MPSSQPSAAPTSPGAASSEPARSGPAETATPEAVADAALDLEPRLWRDLFSLTKKEAEDRRVLERQLRRWSRARGNVDAALYAAVDGGFRSQARVGRTRFPETVAADDLQRSTEAWQRIELPDALLLMAASEAQSLPETADPSLMLLAAGSRISELKRQIQEQSFQAKFRGVELEALYDVGLAIASTLDLEELGAEVLLRAVSLLDARRGALYLLDGDHYRLTSRFGGAARDELAHDEIDVERLRQDDYRGPEGWIPGAAHLMAVMVEIDGDPRGLLVVADKESRHGVGPFHPTDRRTLSLFGNQAAIALENAKLHKLALDKERLEREMELAADIQKQLLPEVMPTIPGYEVGGWNRPARHVGGDYYDCHELGNGHWGLVVGDVTGKGMPAALLVSTLHSALRVLLDRMEIGPALIERLSRHIFESSSANKFITMLLATLDTGNSRLTYLNAGHNPGLLVHADGEVEHLTSAGLPLGLMARGRYTAASHDLKPGDLVCLYSDGITECEAPDEEEYALERLIELLQDHRTEPLPDLIRRIDRAVTEFAQGRPQGDDQTVVLLRYCEKPTP